MSEAILTGGSDSAPVTGSAVRSRGAGKAVRTVEQLLGEPTRLPLGVVLKVWGDVLTALDRRHADGEPAPLLLAGHADRWQVKSVPAGEGRKLGRCPGLTGYPKATGLDDLPGEVRFRADGVTSYPPGPVPAEFRADRFSAPEAAGRGEVGPPADVYAAAHLALALIAGKPVAVTADDVPAVLIGLRLFRPDLPPAVQLVLEACLAADPADRPATAAAARALLEAAVAAELDAAREGPRTMTAWTCPRRISLGWRKHRELADEFTDVLDALDDELLFTPVGEDLLLAAAFDGVTTTTVGTGGYAAACAKQALPANVAALENKKAYRDKRPDPDAPPEKVWAWLSALLRDAIRGTHTAVVRAVQKRYAAELVPGVLTPQTTVTAALVWGDLGVLGWVGDSPAFLAGAAGVARLTAPHTAGWMATQQAGSTRALRETSRAGALAHTLGQLAVEPDGTVEVYDVGVVGLTPFRFRPGSVLLVGTDGVFDRLGGGGGRAADRFLAGAARVAYAPPAALEDEATDTPPPVPDRAAAGPLFDALWREAAGRSDDDRTLLVFGAEFETPGPSAPAGGEGTDDDGPGATGAAGLPDSTEDES